MAKKTSKPYNSGGGGLFGFTPNQMRAQIANLSAKPTGAVMRVGADQAYAISKFGTGLRGSVKKQFVGARANAQEQAVIQSMGKKTLAAGGRTIEDIGLIFKQGAKQQAAAFAYAKAQQLQQQSGASDAESNAFAQQLFMAELQHRWAVQDQKRAEQAALGAAADQTKGIVTGVMATAPTITTTVQQAYLMTKDATEEGQPVSATAVYQTALANGALVEGTPEAVYALQMAQQLTANGGNVEEAVPKAITGTFGGYQGFDLDMVAQATLAGVSANAASTRREYVLNNPGGFVAEANRPPEVDDDDNPVVTQSPSWTGAGITFRG